jgi:hypothetical protein
MDWAQSFLYGVADSGTMVQHHLLATYPLGKPILSGGATAPKAVSSFSPSSVSSPSSFSSPCHALDTTAPRPSRTDGILSKPKPPQHQATLPQMAGVA